MKSRVPNEDSTMALSPSASASSAAFMARVRVMRDGFAYHETETFDRRPTATSWIKSASSRNQA